MVFVCNIVILLFSGIVNIILCDRLRRKKCELCAGKVHFNAFLNLFSKMINKTNIVMLRRYSIDAIFYKGFHNE